jgi:hypothetical protein
MNQDQLAAPIQVHDWEEYRLREAIVGDSFNPLGWLRHQRFADQLGVSKRLFLRRSRNWLPKEWSNTCLNAAHLKCLSIFALGLGNKDKGYSFGNTRYINDE